MTAGNKNFFDKAACSYTNPWMKSKKAEKKVRKIAGRFGIKKGMSIVEAGCGNGEFTRFIIERAGENGNICLVDSSRRMLLKAKKRMKHNKDIKYRNRCVTKTGIKGKSADMVVCFNSFPHFYPKEKTLKEFRRVLKDKGALVISHDINISTINRMHGEIGFNMKKHRMPLKGEMKEILGKTGFKMVSYTNNSYYLLKAKKI